MTDPALRWFGVALTLGHLFTFAHWWLVYPAATVIGPDVAPICWPFFEDCHAYRWLTAEQWAAVLLAYGALAVLAGLLFVQKKTAPLAVIALALLSALEVLVVAQDYRLRLNQHTMALWVAAVFLFLPDKRRALRLLLVAFYVAAGSLKLDPDWLSGAVFYGERPLLVPEALLVPSLYYVALLELVIVFGILSRLATLRYVVWFQLVLFHLASFTVVGFYYPLLCLALLSVFPLTWHMPEADGDAPEHAPSDLRDVLRGRLSGTTYGALGVFALLALLPLAHPGDTALTGEGRLLSLHMLDARIDCEATVRPMSPDGSRVGAEMRINMPLPARIRCDPIVYLGVARSLCRDGWQGEEYGDLWLHLRARRSRHRAASTVVDVPGFCGEDLSYDMFSHNTWIRATGSIEDAGRGD